MARSVYLGHGASGNAASMAPFVKGLRARGIDAHALNLPTGKAERAVPVLLEQVPDRPGVVVGGQSFGGRVASMAVADSGRQFAGLVCFCYPLHRPGRPVDLRVEHWPRVTVPALLLSGEADPFARIDLLRRSTSRLPHAELVTYPRVGHGLKPVLDDVLDRVARFVEALPE